MDVASCEFGASFPISEDQNCKTVKCLVNLLAGDILKEHDESFPNHKFVKANNTPLAPEALTVCMKNFVKKCLII
jgi:hypothetical protein